MPGSTAPRKIDRERRSKIIVAALEVIRRDGVEGLSHRRVAAEAGIPLGSTWYYFGTVEDLLAEAMRQAVEHDMALLSAQFGEEGTVAERLARVLHGALTTRRDSVKVIIELYTAALRREQLREVALAWEASWEALFEPEVGAIAARAAGAVVSGVAQRGMLESEPPSLSELLEITRYLLRED